MDTTGIAVVVLLIVAIVVLAILFRRGSFEAGMEALGAKLNLKGRAQPEADAAKPPTAAPSTVATPASSPRAHASGAGAVAVGGSADRANISTKVERGR